MSRKILLLSIVMAFLISGCGWHIPFFGSDKVEEDTPLVQDATQVDEDPQYSGQLQAPEPDPNQYQQPANQAQYAQPAAAYGQNPGTAAGGAFQPGQPYNPNTNYALNASSGYGAPAGQPQPYYGAGGNGMPPAAAPYGTNFNGGLGQNNPAASSGTAFGTPQNDSLAFSGIKRKVLYIISYPQRGLTPTPQDQFSQKIYQHLAQSPGINLIPKEAVERYNDAHNSLSSSIDAHSRLSKMGQGLGAQAILLEKIQFTANFNDGGAYAPPTQQTEMQLIDTATGYPVKSYSLSPTTPGAAQVIDGLVNHVRMIDWNARVIKVEKKRILINAGRFSGLQIGQNLRVYAKGSEIKDPKSKLSLGQAQGILKGTVKVIDFFGLDGAICEPLAAAGKFKQGDMVKAAE